MSQDIRFDDEEATARRARLLNLAYIDTSKLANKPLFRQIMTVPELYKFRAIPLQADPHNINFGITTTTSEQTMDYLRQHFTDQEVKYTLISDGGFREYMHLYDPPKKIEYHDIHITNKGTANAITDVSATLAQVHANDMLAYLVQQAHMLNASDIHVENQEDHIRIRFRIDGVLHDIAHLSHEKNRMLIAAIASAANVSTAADEAQQGHIAERLRMAEGTEVDINLRVETVPVINGMDVVMRLFNLDKNMFTLDRLGLSPPQRAILDDIIKRPSGLVLAVGPTGSGKTTTLYSILNSLNNEERKIVTIEEPVEYQFDGITQIPVSSKGEGEANFGDKLRAVLRLDPDVVMVGEIRDMDTAKTALQASLTGHLVLATFHAASASAALTRLMDVIGENPLFVSAIRLIMAQRLVRRLDDKLKQPYSPTQPELAWIQQAIEAMPAGAERPSLNNLQLFQPGTSEQNPYGYTGQVALREQLVMKGEIINVLATSGTHLTTEQMEAAAIKDGMVTMLQDGVLQVLAGHTTLAELARVIG